MTATVETSSRKLHGFSIDALIGRQDDNRSRTESRTPPSPAPRVESSQSPETENRVAAWGDEGLKHFFAGYSSSAEVAASLYQPLRVCNRAISAGSSAFLPPQLSSLPFNPLLYGLREFPHHSPHPILTPRYPGFVHPRYHMGPPPSLLFHPYRKPKRNRTAFSPSQLLQLEQAFEKNHYVVGQERKQLASKLQLSETQVKVWFQNRRTKHKRMKAEEEAGEKTGDEAEKKSGDKKEGASESEQPSDGSEVEEDRSSDVEHDEEEEEGVEMGGDDDDDEEEELCVTDQGDS